MTRRDVIKSIYLVAPEQPIVFSTGYSCREAFDIEDRRSNFYMLGSMGLAASIGIGIAVNCSEKSIIVIDGDGSFLMCPNNIFIAGELKLKNLIHIVIDNQMYESTGRQKTYSGKLDFSNMASASGYNLSKKIDNIEEFNESLANAIHLKNGPVFFHLLVDTTNTQITRRVSIPLVQLKNRMSDFLQTE